ncbi:MAG: Flp pilus assembly complex ATPase component TadA [Patescibacteria group bacterium]|nr:Flp pilus assembly complex ATPase component TadA [Patescibacteria group bacterium]
MVQFDEDKQVRKIDQLHHKEEEELVQYLSDKYNLPYVDLSSVAVNTDALRYIEEQQARTAKMAVFNIINKKLSIAVRDPSLPAVNEIIGELKQKGMEPELYMASTGSLEKAWNLYKDLSFASETKSGSLQIQSEEIEAIVSQAKDLPTIISILTNTVSLKKSYRVSRILETIIAGALAVGASDIHIEPEETYIRLRYRLDGVLQEVLRFDTDTYNLVLSRLKLLSGLKLNIKKQSQDGRFSVHVGQSDIELRVSVLPGAYNESVVMRILDPKSISVPLESLGIPPKLLDILLKEIDKPNGMILTTGPTGSGKTTTLYAFLKKSYNPGVKIITIEDPVEYHLPGITQTQVNDKGYNFLEGLRAAVRQDPDIIMVGEIRDDETADIAINSALTGHLVFSTLHTNSAAGAFPRLIDLHVNPKIITSALTVAMAQRLVRRLCPFCKKEVPIDSDPIAKHEIEKTLSEIVDRSQIPENTTKMWQGVGCPKCNNTGYKGRIGVYEAIMIDQKIEDAVEANPSEREIVAASKDQGIMNMQQDGIVKILQGVTDLAELKRVVEIVE